MAKVFEYQLVPIHCTTGGQMKQDSTDCLTSLAAGGWRVVAGSVHQFGAESWRVLMEREQ